MIIGMSMDQEICLILGQVSPSLLHQVRNLQKDMFLVWGETDKTASNIQARSFMASWRGMSKNAKPREKLKWAIEKPKAR